MCSSWKRGDHSLFGRRGPDEKVEFLSGEGPRDHARFELGAAVQQCFDEHRPDDLGPLLDVLEGAELQLAFEQLGRIGDPHLRAATTAAVLRRAGALADRSIRFLDVDVFRAWPPASTRAELFTLVGASAWWIRRHGGDRSVADAIDAAFDVSRWWR